MNEASPTEQDRELTFDVCLTQIETGQATVADCLARHPDLAADIEPMLRVAEALFTAVVEPMPQPAVQAVRERVLSQVAEVRRARSRPTRHRMLFTWANSTRVWVIVAVLVVVMGVGLTNSYQAAASSLPGDGLYPFKLASERLTLAVTPDPDERAALHASFALRRVDEALQVRQRGGDLEETTLQSAASEMERAIASMDEPTQSSDERVVLERIVSLIDAGEQKLADAGLSNQPALKTAAAFRHARQRAFQMMEHSGQRDHGLIGKPPKVGPETPTLVPTPSSEPSAESSTATPSIEDQTTPESNVDQATPSPGTVHGKALGHSNKDPEATAPRGSAGHAAQQTKEPPGQHKETASSGAARKADATADSATPAATSSISSPEPQATSAGNSPDATNPSQEVDDSNSHGKGESGKSESAGSGRTDHGGKGSGNSGRK